MSSVGFLLVFVVAVFGDLPGYGQIDLVNVSAVRKDSAFIFAGLTNRIEVTGGSSGKWQLKARHSEVEERDMPGVFMVEPGLNFAADTFSQLKNGVQVLTKKFVVLATPIKARLGVLQKDTATRQEIIANKGVVLYTPGCINCASWKIVGFRIKFESREIAAATNVPAIEGRLLNEEANTIIMKLVHGDKVIFDGIRVVARGARIREVPGFTIVIR